MESGRTQLGLQLIGRPAAAADSGDDDEGTLGVFVAGILPGTVAAKDGNILVGDQLLQVANLTYAVVTATNRWTRRWTRTRLQFYGATTIRRPTFTTVSPPAGCCTAA